VIKTDFLFVVDTEDLFKQVAMYGLNTWLQKRWNWSDNAKKARLQKQWNDSDHGLYFLW
jgi:hypothetical protein